MKMSLNFEAGNRGFKRQQILRRKSDKHDFRGLVWALESYLLEEMHGISRMHVSL